MAVGVSNNHGSFIGCKLGVRTQIHHTCPWHLCRKLGYLPLRYKTLEMGKAIVWDEESIKNQSNIG
jgi:hypothetical protein